MDFKAISAAVETDFQQVNDFIFKQLHTHVPLIKEIGNYIIDSGGKRLRPLVCLLSARALGYEGHKHVEIAAVVEFLHTATLLHDDVVDESSLRRGKASANEVWGNAPSVLVGDFLISRSFQMVVNVGNMRVLQILSDATNLIAEGEVLQLINCKNPDTNEAQYMEVIRYKTAKMFEASAQSGAVLAQPGEALELAFARYADHLGLAFQLIDDVLDYTGSAEEMGKNVGDDLAEGKPTLPLIYALQHASPADQDMIRTAIRTGGLDKIDAITQAVRNCGAIDYTIERANEQSRLAKEALGEVKDSVYKEALLALSDLAVARNH
ncbi:polyprenyl synthetase family protein [Ketobacter alkanivorans]|uniref:Octaprenyl diphosphate synthase n=1 Tax=Ketobacter alkanivorans TaxID=1917421 RepID=A0A2K9LKE5_9GAMM|nr:polyprenyl synthetase family protein [Ketobacter alkanivorans]AUM11975.1 octaprenyl diphosphate synthase [Ketobacter alkanivorans]